MAEDYGLSAISDSLAKQNSLMRKRQEEELAQKNREGIANAEKARIADRSAKVSQDLVGQLAPLVGTVDKAEKARVEVETLRSSNNPLDFLDLIGKQVQNPQMYTQSGRQKSVAEATQIMNVKTQVASLQQAAFADLSQVVDASLASSGGALEASKLNELQNQELINAEITRVQTQSQTLAANQQLQEQKLAMMSEEETRAAYAASQGKPLNIGGITFSPGVLESRMLTMNDRNEIRENRAALQEAKKFELDRKLAKRELETMNIEELRPMILSGDPRFELSDIKATYDTKMAAQSEATARLGQEFQFQDFGARVTVPAMQDVERMTPAVPPNTPLAAALGTYKNSVGTVMQLTKPFTDQGLPIPLGVLTAANVAIAESKKQMDIAIDKEATLRSNGNKELKTIYAETYRGNPAPRDVIEQYLSDRLDKNEPLTAVLPPEVATSVQRRFNDIYGETVKRDGMMPNFDKKEARAEAIRQAITEGVGAKITERTQQLFTDQLDQPNHPLYGAVSKNQFLGLVSKADAEGIEFFRQNYGLTEDEMTRFIGGAEIEGKVNSSNVRDLQRIQNQSLYMQMDGIEAGLGKKYADWWSTQGTKFIGAVSQKRDLQAKQSGIQAMAMESFAGGMEQKQQAAYMQGMAEAYDSYDDRKAVRYNEMVSFDLDPGHRQAALLQFNPDLSDSEKKLFMKKFILPIIQEGKQKKLPYEGINAAIENAIDANMTQDPEVAKVMKKIAKNRSSEVEKMESVMTQPFWRQAPDQPRIGFQPNAWLRRTTAQSRYEWYRESLRGD